MKRENAKNMSSAKSKKRNFHIGRMHFDSDRLTIASSIHKIKKNIISTQCHFNEDHSSKYLEIFLFLTKQFNEWNQYCSD